MRAGGGKSKGAAFERLTCNTLSKWVSKGKRDDLFWRSAMSGGRATIGRRAGIKRDSQSGDISAIAPEGHPLTNLFSIECKTYRSLELDSLIFGKKAGISTFWSQCRRDAEESKKLPMIIAKQNGKPVLVGLSLEGRVKLKITGVEISCLAHYPNYDLSLFFFQELVEKISPPFSAIVEPRKLLRRRENLMSLPQKTPRQSERNGGKATAKKTAMDKRYSDKAYIKTKPKKKVA